MWDSSLPPAVGPDQVRPLRQVIPEPLRIAEPPIELLDQRANSVVMPPLRHGHFRMEQIARPR
jgi:hypothetical protein